MAIKPEVRTKQELSLALYEQAKDQAYLERGRAECEHIWARTNWREWLCAACGDMADFSEGWE